MFRQWSCNLHCLNFQALRCLAVPLQALPCPTLPGRPMPCISMPILAFSLILANIFPRTRLFIRLFQSDTLPEQGQPDVWVAALGFYMLRESRLASAEVMRENPVMPEFPI